MDPPRIAIDAEAEEMAFSVSAVGDVGGGGFH
jgi:hypothetical protein